MKIKTYKPHPLGPSLSLKGEGERAEEELTENGRPNGLLGVVL